MPGYVWFLLIVGIIFLIILGVAIRNEWNGFLLVCNIALFIPSFIITMAQLMGDGEANPFILFLAGIIALSTFLGIFHVLFRSRCPQCRKFFAAKKINEELLQQGDIYYKTVNSTNGNRTTKAYQKNLYRCDYVCKNCGHEWSRRVTREVQV